MQYGSLVYPQSTCSRFHWSTSIQHAVGFTGLPLFNMQYVSLVYLQFTCSLLQWSTSIHHAVCFTCLPPFNMQSISLVYLHSTCNQCQKISTNATVHIGVSDLEIIMDFLKPSSDSVCSNVFDCLIPQTAALFGLSVCSGFGSTPHSSRSHLFMAD